jgi:hypothetical protein
MKLNHRLIISACVVLTQLPAVCYADAVLVPVDGPRTWFAASARQRFVDFCRTGEGQATFDRIRADFDRDWLDAPFPAEPPTYGDSEPAARTGEQVDAWRHAQDVCNQIATVAEAATLIWLVTGEPRYLAVAHRWLLGTVDWDPRAVSDIYYNDEAHFRLWRKLPSVYDQLRDTLPATDRARLLMAWADRGRRSVEWIKASGIERVRPNSIEVRPSSHPVRFMAMTGIAGLALWDDLPEARAWFDFAYAWYRDSFTPWGGADGGWAEGVAYWRGVYEHANFQDALMVLGHPAAYAAPFWRQNAYFQVYFTQPYLATQFGDLSNAGKFNMEPGVRHFLRHLSRVLGDGAILAYTDLYTDPRPSPETKGLQDLNRIYPVATEYLLRDFLGTQLPWPSLVDLATLPANRHFADIGWVAFHSALGQPADDIHLSFKSSPYGSFSHSHADQNAFILNAYGENLAINSGYREYHRSLHHQLYTRQTISKNALLIDGRGQDVQNSHATGSIRHFVSGPRYAWARGDATPAYQLLQPAKRLQQVLRDVVFVDQRYFVLRDAVAANQHLVLTWQLHAEQPMVWDEPAQTVLIRQGGAALGVALASPEGRFTFRHQTGFPVPPDPKYRDPAELAARQYFSAPAVDQAHFAADLLQSVRAGHVYAVLWPDRDAAAAAALRLEVVDATTIIVHRPDGGADHIQFAADTLTVSSLTQP